LLLALSTTISLTRKQGKIMLERGTLQDTQHQQGRHESTAAKAHATAAAATTTAAVSPSTITGEAATAVTIVATAAASVSLRGGGGGGGGEVITSSSSSPAIVSNIIRKSSMLHHQNQATGRCIPPTAPVALLRQRDSVYLWSSLAAGAGSGALASILCAPLDLIKTRLQVWGEVTTAHSASSGAAAAAAAASAASSIKNNVVPAHYAITQMLRDIIKTDGIRGCFRGLGATLITVPTFWGVYCKYNIHIQCTYYMLLGEFVRFLFLIFGLI
jgi:Mitochondrial carrier protein